MNEQNNSEMAPNQLTTAQQQPTVPDTFSTLFIGYSTLWILIVIYLAWLLLRLRRVENRLDKALTRLDSKP